MFVINFETKLALRYVILSIVGLINLNYELFCCKLLYCFCKVWQFGEMQYR